jgi:hypothetical protein
MRGVVGGVVIIHPTTAVGFKTFTLLHIPYVDARNVSRHVCLVLMWLEYIVPLLSMFNALILVKPISRRVRWHYPEVQRLEGVH